MEFKRRIWTIGKLRKKPGTIGKRRGEVIPLRAK